MVTAGVRPAITRPAIALLEQHIICNERDNKQSNDENETKQQKHKLIKCCLCFIVRVFKELKNMA